MIILLSPAKRLKEDNADTSIAQSTPVFLEQAAEVMSVLQRKSPKALQKLHQTSSELAERNYQRNQNWSEASHSNGIAAIQMFDGEVYRGLAYDKWSESASSFAQDHLRILSGLYGALRPFDRILPYRLEMGTSLAVARKKNLYAFWGDRIYRHMLEGQNASWFLDLASKEYGQVIHSFIPKDKLHQVDFLEDKGDGKAPRAIQVYLKQARGMLARFALEEAVEHPEELREFEEKGYQFDPSRSTLHKTVFLRHL